MLFNVPSDVPTFNNPHNTGERGELVFGGTDPAHYTGSIAWVPLVSKTYWAITLGGTSCGRTSFPDSPPISTFYYPFPDTPILLSNTLEDTHIYIPRRRRRRRPSPPPSPLTLLLFILLLLLLSLVLLLLLLLFLLLFLTLLLLLLFLLLFLLTLVFLGIYMHNLGDIPFVDQKAIVDSGTSLIAGPKIQVTLIALKLGMNMNMMHEIN